MADGGNIQKAQNFANRGRQALEARNFAFAVDMLSQAVEAAPEAVEYRRLLRAAEIANFRANPPGALALKMQGMGSYFQRQKILSLAKKGKGDEAIAEAEKLMRQNPLNPDFIECAVKAAEAAGRPEIALVSIEAASAANQNDEALLERVAAYYMAVKDYSKARDAYAKLVKLRPHDQRALQMFKNAEAQASIAGGWEGAGKPGQYINLLANEEQARKIDAQNKAVVSGSDAEMLIAEAREKIEKEPANVNYYRALARIYVQNKMFAEAAEVLEAAKKVAAADPNIDGMLSSVRVQDYAARTEALRKEGREEEAAELQHEMDQFVFDDLAERVGRYPNDLRLRYELGLQYYKYGFYKDAMEQFQLSQRSPKERVGSLYHLAMCFIANGQRDMAVLQLKAALTLLTTMDDMKKMVLYRLGLCAEESGDIDEAYRLYSDVYSADVTFEDVGERMLRISKMREGGGENG